MIASEVEVDTRWRHEAIPPLLTDIDRVLNSSESQSESLLVWVTADPGLGASSLLRNVLRELGERHGGWGISDPLVDDSQWGRVAAARRLGIGQPLPRANSEYEWLCLAFDGAASRTDPTGELCRAIGVLSMVNDVGRQPATAGEAAKPVLKNLAVEGSKKAVAFVPLIGPVIQLLVDASDLADPRDIRDLVLAIWPRNRPAPDDTSVLLGEAVADQLLNAVAALDPERASVPIVVVLDNAEDASVELQTLIRRLLLDESERSRAVAVIATASSEEPVPWLESLHDGLSATNELVDSTAGVQRSIRYRLGGHDDAVTPLPTMDRADAELLISSLAPEPLLSADVAEVIVDRSLAPDGVLTVRLLLDHLAHAADRHRSHGTDALSVPWAQELRSQVEVSADSDVGRCFTDAPQEALLLAALCRVGRRTPIRLYAALAGALQQSPDPAESWLAQQGMVTIGRRDVEVARYRLIVEAIGREIARRPKGVELLIEQALDSAASLWIMTTCDELVQGDLTWSDSQMSLVSGVVRTGIHGRGTHLHPHVRRALLLSLASGATEYSSQLLAARRELSDARTDRGAEWLFLAFAVSTLPPKDVGARPLRIRSAVAGEALGFLADQRACGRELRAHWAAGALLANGLREATGNPELAERAAIAIAPVAPSSVMGWIDKLPVSCLNAILEGLAQEGASWERERLILRLVAHGADRIRALALVVPHASTAIESAVAMASLGSGLPDDVIAAASIPSRATDDDDDPQALSGDAATPADRDPSADEPLETDWSAVHVEDLRIAAFTLLTDHLASTTSGSQDSRRIRDAAFRLSQQFADDLARANAYYSLRDHVVSPADAAMLCELVDLGNDDRVASAHEVLQRFPPSADLSAARAVLIGPDVEAPKDLLRALASHWKHPLCLAHGLRLDPRGASDRHRLHALTASVPSDEESAVDELVRWSSRDPRALLPLAANLSVLSRHRSEWLLRALEAAFDRSGDDLRAQLAVAIVTHPSSSSSSPSDTLKSIFGEARAGGWPDRYRDEFARVVVESTNRHHEWKRARAWSMRHLLKHQSRHGTNLSAYLVGATAAHTSAPKDVVAKVASAANDHVRAAIAVLSSPDATDAQWRACWHALCRHAARQPRLLEDLDRLARTDAQRADIRRILRIHEHADPGAALRTLPQDRQLTMEDCHDVLLWSALSPTVACQFTQRFPRQPNTDDDPLTLDVRRELRRILTRATQHDLDCASVLLDHDRPPREVLTELHGVLSEHPRSFERSVLLVRSAQEVNQAESALDALLASLSGRYGDPRMAAVLKMHSSEWPSFALARLVIALRTEARDTRKSLDDCLAVIQDQILAADRTVRLSAWVTAVELMGRRFRLARRLGRKPEELGNQIFQLLKQQASDPRFGPSVLPRLDNVARKFDEGHVRGAYLAHLQTAQPPNPMIARQLVKSVVQDASSPRRSPAAELAKVLERLASSNDPNALQFMALLTLVRNKCFKRNVSPEPLIKYCRGAEFSPDGVAAWALATELGVSFSNPPRVQSTAIEQRLLDDWYKYMNPRTSDRVWKVTQELEGSLALLVRAWAAFHSERPGRTTAHLRALHDRLDDPVLAVAFSRLATSSTEMEEARQALTTHAGSDLRAARELLRFGLTLRRGTNLFEILSSYTYPDPLEQAILLAEVATTDHERDIATARLESVAQTPRVLLALSSLATRDREVVESVRNELSRDDLRPHDRHLLGQAFVRPYIRIGGLRETGIDLLSTLDGEERRWGPTALAILRDADEGNVVKPDAEERLRIVNCAIRAARPAAIRGPHQHSRPAHEASGDASLEMGAVSVLLDEGEEMRLVKAMFGRRGISVEELIDLCYSMNRTELVQESIAALRPHWREVPETAVVALWKLEEGDLDDPDFASAWHALEAHAVTSPYALLKLIQFSKKPRSQLALAKLLVILHRASDAPGAANQLVRAVRHRLHESWRHAPETRRRRYLAALNILGGGKEVARHAASHLIVDDATSYEIAGGVSPFLNTASMRVVAETACGTDRDPLETVRVFELLGSVNERCAVLAGRIALKTHLLSNGQLDFEEQDELRRTLIARNQRWWKDWLNVQVTLWILATDRRSLGPERIELIESVLRRDGTPEWLLEPIARATPLALAERVARRIRAWAAEAPSDSMDAAANAAIRLLPRPSQGQAARTSGARQGQPRSRAGSTPDRTKPPRTPKVRPRRSSPARLTAMVLIACGLAVAIGLVLLRSL